MANSALYTPDKLLQNEYLWLTRVPENIKEANELVHKKDKTIIWQKYDEGTSLLNLILLMEVFRNDGY